MHSGSSDCKQEGPVVRFKVKLIGRGLERMEDDIRYALEQTRTWAVVGLLARPRAATRTGSRRCCSAAASA